MSFLDKLPANYKSIKMQLRTTSDRQREVASALDRQDYGHHDCDCEYCPVPEQDLLTDRAVGEYEEELEKLEETINEYKLTIRRIESYAKFMKVELPESK